VAVPIDDPLQRRNAIALQVFSLILWSAVLFIEGVRLAKGITWRSPLPSLVNYTDMVLLGIAFWALRSGRYATGVMIFVAGFTIVQAGGIAYAGLEYSRDALKNLAVPLALSALLLGRRALWTVLFVVSAAMAIALARDHYLLGGVGPRPSPGAPVGQLGLALIVFTILAVVLDRFGLTLREALSDSLVRQHKLEVTTGDLQREMGERQRVEARLVEAQKLEAVARLSGGIAHDFNNILTVILSYTTMLADELGEGHRAHDDLLQMRAAGERGADLTRQLLAFSRRQVLRPRTVDLNDIVHDMEKMLRRLIGEDVELVTQPLAGRALVNVDPGQIEQVIMNLAVNARDAMPQGGKLTIEIGRVELDAAAVAGRPIPPGSYRLLKVTDNGTGMDAKVMERIFEPFFTTKEVGKGTGLGLATVLGILQQSGGDVRVTSESGKGTTFCIYLPLAEKEAGALPSEPPVEARALGGTETILVVEDEDTVRRLVRSVLQRQGYQVLEAGNPGEALLIFEQHPAIDLVLTDVVMPRISGPALASRLLALRPSLKIIYMSGHIDPSAALDGALGSGAAFLQKPVTPGALLSRLREVLDTL
jgi:signal transduction histidine kinase